jgi:NitT/TauT family transport system ATP-binding protein
VSTQVKVAADPKIVIDDLSVRFEHTATDVVAVDRISLTVAENEFVCIMGPSGCGKTTLLNVIAGIVEPTSGEVRVGGARVTGPGPDRAVVFQDDAVFPWMTVEDNIGYSLRMRGRPTSEIAAVVNHYVALVGLADFRRAWPRQLSGGMKKRVDLARGYAADPDVLLMDEPFGALDIMTKERLQEELRKLWLVAKRTVVFITHDLEEALFLGDRVILMSPRPGRIDKQYRPGFPAERDMSLKTTPEFVRYARELREALQSQHAQPTSEAA